MTTSVDNSGSHLTSRTVRLRNGGQLVVALMGFNWMQADDVERRLLNAVTDALQVYESERRYMVLPTGTIVHVGGFPLQLTRDAEAFTSAENEGLVQEAIKEQATKKEPTVGVGEVQGATSDK